MQQDFDLRSTREFEERRKRVVQETNMKIQTIFLDQIQTACYMPCMKGVYYEDLTPAQEQCLLDCSEKYRLAEYIVSQCYSAHSTQASNDDR